MVLVDGELREVLLITTDVRCVHVGKECIEDIDKQIRTNIDRCYLVEYQSLSWILYILLSFRFSFRILCLVSLAPKKRIESKVSLLKLLK